MRAARGRVRRRAADRLHRRSRSASRWSRCSSRSCSWAGCSGAVPRVRHGADGRHRGLGRRVADADADDVRPLRDRDGAADRAVGRGSTGAIDRVFRALQNAYGAQPRRWRCAGARRCCCVTLAVLSARSSSTGVVPKGFMPIQDTGAAAGLHPGQPRHQLRGDGRAAEARRQRPARRPGRRRASAARSASPRAGPASTAASSASTLKPLEERKISSEEVIARLRPKLMQMAGIQTILWSAQDLRGGGSSGGTGFQFVMLDQNIERAARLDQQARGRAARRARHRGRQLRPGQGGAAGQRGDRPRRRLPARRLGQRDRRGAQQCLRATPGLDHLHAAQPIPRRARDDAEPADRPGCSSTGSMSRAPAARRSRSAASPSSSATPRRSRCATEPVPGRQHQLQPQARHEPGRRDRPGAARRRSTCACPTTIRTDFAGNAKFLQQSLSSQPMLIMAALLTIYIVLGVLYESLLHPMTILSTLPSAGLGALLAVLVTGTETGRAGHHRHRAADGHRQEERDHAGRLRARGGARAAA